MHSVDKRLINAIVNNSISLFCAFQLAIVDRDTVTRTVATQYIENALKFMKVSIFRTNSRTQQKRASQMQPQIELNS